MAFRVDHGTLAPPKRLDNGRLIVEARLTRTGTLKYRNPDGSTRVEYRDDAEVFSPASLASASLIPFTDDHPPQMVTADNAARYTVGSVGENVRRDGIYVVAPVAVNSAVVVAKISGGKRQVSCGYSCDLDETPGVTPDGERYDARQINIVYNHLALVDVGRAGTAELRMDGAAVEVSPVPAVSVYVQSADFSGTELHKLVTDALRASSLSVSVDRADGVQILGSSWETGVGMCVRSKTHARVELTNIVREALAAAGTFVNRVDHLDDGAQLHIVKESPVDELNKALAKIAELTAAELAAKTRADTADAKAKDLELKLTAAESEKAVETKRANDEKLRADTAEKARTDAADGYDARVTARVALEGEARVALRTDADPNPDLRAKTDREIKIAVVKRLDGFDIPADRSDEAVTLAYEMATKRAGAASAALGAVTQTIVTNRADTAAPSDEKAAAARLAERTRNAHKMESK